MTLEYRGPSQKAIKRWQELGPDGVEDLEREKACNFEIFKDYDEKVISQHSCIRRLQGILKEIAANSTVHLDFGNRRCVVTDRVYYEDEDNGVASELLSYMKDGKEDAGSFTIYDPEGVRKPVGELWDA